MADLNVRTGRETAIPAAGLIGVEIARQLAAPDARFRRARRALERRTPSLSRRTYTVRAPEVGFVQRDHVPDTVPSESGALAP